MKDEILNKIIEAINQKEELDKYIIIEKERSEIKKENFYSINGEFDQKIAFIDGGNSEIIKGANFSLQLIRIYYTIYGNNKRIKNNRNDYFVLVVAKNKNNNIIYEVNIFGQELKLEFDSFDENLKQGNHRILPATIAEHTRKLLEIRKARDLIQELNNNDLIVRDGDLEENEEIESRFIEELKQDCLNYNIILLGLSKTSTLLTENGNSAIITLSNIAPENEWIYFTNKSEISFVKLNKNSKYVFRLDYLSQQRDLLISSLNGLKNNSRDPIFLGYPYGLIEADKLARVSNNEAQQLNLSLLSKKKEFEKYQKTVDAHDLLNII